ncbi:MAG: GGDEF domain-containing protein [Spirochaetota bacterium]
MDNADSVTNLTLLKKTAIFSLLGERELETIARYSSACDFNKGEMIFQEGGAGDALYIVDKGEVVITKKSQEGGEMDVARFIAGDCFGELDLFTNSPRRASATAASDIRVLMFPVNGMGLGNVLKEQPAISARILHSFLVGIAGRIRNANRLIKENSPWVQELQRQMYGDKLTGLYNKTYLEENLGGCLKDKNRPLSLLMIKPDNFKVINDTYGHEAGDHALQLMSAKLKEITAEDGITVRFMGNELAAVLPGLNRQRALNEAERIQKILNKLDLTAVTGGNPFSLSVSIGISVFPEHGESSDRLIQSAHELPLIGRSRGGNKILFPEDK